MQSWILTPALSLVSGRLESLICSRGSISSLRSVLLVCVSKNHEIGWNIWDWAVVCQKDVGCIRDSFFALDLESNTAISCNFQSAMLACLVAKCLGHKILVQRCCHLFLLGCQICLVQIARIIGWCISSPWSTTMATWSLERTVTWTSRDYVLPCILIPKWGAKEAQNLRNHRVLASFDPWRNENQSLMDTIERPWGFEPKNS